MSGFIENMLLLLTYDYSAQFVCIKDRTILRITIITQNKSLWLTVFRSIFGALFCLLEY